MIHDPRKCNAFHSACENIRDAMTDPLWTEQVRSTTLTELDVIAEGYVHDGMTRCTCPPKFTHDSDCCVFLGTFTGRDLYVCTQGGGLLTVIARRSSEGSDYISGWEFAGTGRDPWLTEARHRAETNGYRA